jgi:sigma-B regulation protein RsbU (phosphoserine phosphatase)
MAGDGALPPGVQAALDLAPCGLLRTDAYGAIQRANAAFCQWTGHSRDELRTRKLQDLMTIGGRMFYQTHLHPLLQMQGSVSEVKLELVRSDGQPFPVVLNAQRHLEGGTVFVEFSVMVARDRDKYERELLLARRRLEALVAEEQDRAQIAEQMVGIVSHDLRNPLQTIQMGALLLTRGGPTPHQLSVLGRISRAGERAHRLIADLLDFTAARLGRGLAMQPRPLSPHELVADVVGELSQAYPGRSIVHVRDGDGECLVDGDRCAQLVGNLVSNAMAYGDPQSPVTVRSSVREHDLLLEVHNHGAPIPLDAQARMFQPMVRGEQAEGSTRSVGLGLFIVGEIAKAHGGRVTLASDAAVGTTFTVALPRHGPAREPTSSPAAPSA